MYLLHVNGAELVFLLMRILRIDVGNPDPRVLLLPPVLSRGNTCRRDSRWHPAAAGGHRVGGRR